MGPAPYPLLNRIWLSVIVLIAFFAQIKPARASVNVGDIAVIGWNSDPASSTKTFSVVFLANIFSGETLFFTDKGISSGTWQADLATEGIFSLTTTSSIAAGTVIQFSVTSGITPMVSSSPSVGTLTVTNGWISTSTASPFGNNGDQIIIYQGSAASPTFIFGFNAGINTIGLTNGWNTGGSTGNNYSEIPAGLTNGSNAVSHGGASALDNYVYTGTKSGSKLSLLTAISTASNWSSDDTTPFDNSPGGTSFPGTNPIFTISSGNSAPTNLVLSATSANENVAANATVGTFTATDPDVGNTFTYTLVAGTGDTDNASFNINGSSLRITNSPDFETKSSYSVRVRTTDQGSLTFEKAFTITINNVNETPSDIALSASSVNENVAANSTVGTLSSTDVDAANTFTYTLVAGTGDTDNASFNISGSNLRITNSPDFETKSSFSVRIRTSDQGNLTYEEAFTITINDVAEGVLLSSSPTLTFTSNNASITGDDIASDGEGGSQAISDIDIQVYNISNTGGTLLNALSWQNNGFLGSNNGSYTGLTNENNNGSKGIAIKSANGSEFRLNQFSYYNWGESTPFTNTVKGYRDNTEVASMSFQGFDAEYDPLTISLDATFGNVDEVRLYISAGGYMGDQSASNHSINAIQVTSPVTNTNNSPTDITLSASAVNENVAANSTVGTLSSTDADAANTFTYTLVAGTGDTDNASFNISGSTLRITNSPDFETKSSYSIRIRTTDQGSLTYEEAFTITINNVNETPSDITLSASSVNENIAANSTVGTLSSTDADAANTFTYTLVAGTGDTDNASFNISGSNLRITNSPDFETKSSYSIRIRTTDQGSLTYEEAFTITINNVNETPADIALSASSVNENVAANSTVGTLSSTDVDAANTFTYTLVSGTGDTDNASFNISGSNLRITNSPDFETKSSYSIRIRTTDQGSLTYEEAFTITINNVNETPADIALSASSVNENVAANTTVGTLSSTDVDAANTFTYTLVSGTGDTDNASFNISGSNLRITNSPDFETKNSYSVRIRTTDQGSLTYEEAFTITISNVNETPSDIALSASSVNENVAANTTVGTLSSTDVDAANTFTYTLVSGTGDTDNASFNISGSTLRITNSPDFETKNSYSIRIRTTDQGSLTYEEAFTITISNVNETPSDIALSASSVNENVAANTTVGTLSSTDVDAANTFTYTLVSGAGDTDNASFNISGSNLRVTNSPDFETKNSYSIRIRTTDQGSLTYEEAFTITISNVNETPSDIALSASSVNENVAANTTVGTLSSTDVDAANTFTYTLVSGAGDTDNASFNISGSNLRITNSPDFETKSSYSVRLRTTDQGSLTYEEAFTITINDVDEFPTDIDLSSSSINEGSPANSTIGLLTTTPNVSNTYSLVAGTGDADNASFSISGSSLRITSTPDFESKNSYTVRIRTTDPNSLTYEEAFIITINNVNESPSDIALSANAVNENVAANTTVGTLNSTDTDAGNTFTFTLVAGAGDTDNASFNISGSSLRITNSPDFETKSSYNVRIRTTDQGSLTYEEAFTITITDINEAPSDIALSASSVNENVAANTTVGTLSSTDVDAANTFTYTLVAGTGDTDNASFNISGSNLRITSSPDFEGKSNYTVRVRTTDQGSLTYEEAFTINISNVNEVPSDISLSANAVNENVAANTTIGTLGSTDVDAANTFTYTLVSGTGDTDNGSFNISGSNLRITNSPDFETKSSYSIRIRTTDQGSLTYEEAFIITINNVNETPSDLVLSASSVNENVVANTTVGTLSSTDVDASNTFSYTLIAGTGDTDNAFFNISGSSLRITSIPDFETKNSYSVRVRTTDQGSLTYEEAFTVTINDINESPTSISLSTLMVDENVGTSTVVATLSTADEDAGNTFVYSLATGSGDTDNSSFSITGNSLTMLVNPDVETQNSYVLRIKSVDQDDAGIEKSFTILINDLNEDPTDIEISASSVDENIAINTVISTITSNDPDAGSTFTYSLVSGIGDTDNSSFQIQGDGLHILESPDFEIKNTYTIRIQTEDQGHQVFQKSFMITINDVIEPVLASIASLSATSIEPTAVTLGGIVSFDGYVPVTERGVVYNTSGSPTLTDSKITMGSGEGEFSQTVTGLSEVTTYYVRAYAINAMGTAYGNEISFTTPVSNRAPTDLMLSSLSFNENIVENAVIGTLHTIDADPENTFTYRLISGDGDDNNDEFLIDESSLHIKNSPDYEAQSSYDIRIQTMDQHGATFEKSFHVTVGNVNEAPFSLSVSTLSVAENIAAGTVVSTIASADPDMTGAMTYSLAPGQGDNDNASFAIVDNTLIMSSVPDFEAQSMYNIRIRVTDQDGLTYEKSFMVLVEDFDETIPNALFPNGTDQNKTWGISHFGLSEKVTIQVFDSNGQLLFSSEDPQREWDGRYNGMAVPEGTYFYSITLGKGMKYEGSLLVLY
ncbi:gliding motility-associated C-terminal domain-containing protein [Chryseolinea sp. H1M3-3]|uniref:T9SS type B sorting domain-containing protein n=1 Tax=Chryseolinea sp. H1M3-3 TaxID=3034144 RepID=UPI0023EC2C6C|nr:gliding motility-associated C-terminal domain-containing protein [Chryseolinea sp. H1M3-3]